MTEPSAKIICDSISPRGHRLTTMEVVMHRFVLSEFNTHRAFSRNSASSRAIPLKTQINNLRSATAFPVVWASEQPGMQGGSEVEPAAKDEAQIIWEHARDNAIKSAQDLAALGVHKSLANRLIEPFVYHVAVISSTEWENFFTQRVSPLAQPEMRVVAEYMAACYEGHQPTPLEYGKWHLPYVREEETNGTSYACVNGVDWREVSAARCCRVSRERQGSVDQDVEADLKTYARLVAPGDGPPHASPLEHVATPCPSGFIEEDAHQVLDHKGNFVGFDQLRHKVLGFPMAS